MNYAEARLEEAKLEAEAKLFFDSASLAEHNMACNAWAIYVKAIGASEYALTWENTSYQHKKAWIEVIRSIASY